VARDACSFCKIVDGSDPDAQVVGESEHWVAFFPLQPATRGHTLVVPRVHVRDYWQADSEVVADLAGASHLVGRALLEELRPDGMNLITSAGHAAEQSIFHLHMHVVPRWEADRIGPLWPRETSDGDRASDDLATAVRTAISLRQGAEGG
jgi:histidine triad (HIT) family protein